MLQEVPTILTISVVHTNKCYLPCIVLILSLLTIILSSANAMQDQIENASSGGKMSGEQREAQMEDGTASKFGTKSSSPYDTSQKKVGMEGQKNHQMPPASVMTRLILIMVWRKLIRNPNTYSSLLGLIWSLVSYRFIFLPLAHSNSRTYTYLIT